MRNLFKSLQWNEIENDQRYRNQELFVEKYEPRDGKNYDWVYEHAIKQYSEANQAIADLDAKAGGMIQYFAAVAGILAVILTYMLSKDAVSCWGYWSFASGMFLVIISLFFSLSAIRPHYQALPPSIKAALEVTDYYNSIPEAKARFANGIESAVIAEIIVADRKSACIRWSYLYFIIALMILFILLPLCIIFF